MQPVRKKKLIFLLSIAMLTGLVVSLVLYALRQNISLFYSPTQVASGEAPLNHPIRLGGMVEKGSVHRREKGLAVRFKVTDFANTVEIEYEGVLPDLFREGQGIVAEGRLLDAGHFKASTVLAKHDENYMPPEVKQAMKVKGSS